MAKAIKKEPKQEGKLSNSLVLFRYILSLFNGASSLEALSEHLKEPSLEGYDEDNISHYYYELCARLFVNGNNPITEEMLLVYDQNIFRHTQAINQKRRETIKWKYYQYLSLLFTEVYLDMYFNDKEKLVADLNYYLNNVFNFDPKTYHGIGDFKADELNKLVFWSATGSGKTLMMHVNMLQYRHYAEKHNHKINRTLLITPNEGLTTQHLSELTQSGISAWRFSKKTGSLSDHSFVDVIEITKLADKDGDKTVCVDFFEDDNLVFVDEGHRGSSGDQWKANRDKLSKNGFCFEYSATFGQSIAAISNAKTRKDMLEEYAQSTIFDYSYRYFYKDGYGKDYRILNLNDIWNDETLTTYLTASLLNFYQQMRIYNDHATELNPFNIERPLAIFVGGSVTAEKNIAERDVSDIVFLLLFFQRFVLKRAESIDNIARLLNAQHGLIDAKSHPIFRHDAFGYVRDLRMSAEQVYDDILKQLFHCSVSGAQLHMDNLKGVDGEIGLRVGTGEYFGVINVGDTSKLTKKCEAEKINVASAEYNNKSLFETINHADSGITILIGSKKFTEGWSSWRVSMMGLLNVGKSEGSQIIQLFGRGVRLKGYKMSLKRSSELTGALTPESKPKNIRELETLNIFGIKADYMEQFKKFLEDEGLPTNDSDYETFELPIIPMVDLREKKLKYLKVKDGFDFKKDVRVILKAGMIDFSPITLDYYPKIQSLKSAGRASVLDSTNDGKPNEAKLTPEHLAFVDWNKVFFAVVDFKNERSWYNLSLSSDVLKEIAHTTEWYTLYIPEKQMLFEDFGPQTQLWQDLVIMLLKKYVEKAYNNEKSKYNSQHMEVVIIDKDNPNFDEEYLIYLHQELLKDETDNSGFLHSLKQLKEQLKNGTFSQSIRINSSADFEALHILGHLYQPLLYLNQSAFHTDDIDKLIEVKPVALNEGERNFVCDVQRCYDNNQEFFADKELYLLRNKSRKGIGFFDAAGFYPDFIIWLVVGQHQYVSFIDPKGIRNLKGFNDPKIQLYKTIRDVVETNLNDKDITLNSYIVSNTPLSAVKYWADFDADVMKDSHKQIPLFNEHHVYFQGDQKETYVKRILDDMIK